MTFTTVSEHLTRELPLPVSEVLNCRDWNSNTQSSVCEANMYALAKAMSFKGKDDRLSLLIVTTGHNVHWRQGRN